MRERGRERLRGVDSRAYLGRPFRSSPSPEVRHKRGLGSVTSGEWTKVRNRRRKALREGMTVNIRSQQNHDFPFQRAIVHSRIHASIDNHDRSQISYGRDHFYDRQYQTRYGRDGSRVHQQVLNHH
ncbi:hypothetical protein QL285_092415 [Trifolium repens]|nr:hypothetical protein QL285_092415 [Trifolium repens]